jgi:hypothetical protein
LALAFLAVLWAAPAVAQKVGTAAAVNPESSGKQPGGGVRTLTLGAEVVHNERIHTDAHGSVQLLFIDRTSMSIGPNSDITINEYVFDPQAKSGKLAVTVAKGLMRFVGGQVSHSGQATVTTPSASIGIRGGTAIIDVDGTHTRTINLFGRQNIFQSNGTEISLYRPSFMVDILGTEVPVPPTLAPSQLVAFYNAKFEAKPGQTGGSQGKVTPQIVQALADTYNPTRPLGPSVNPVQSPNTYFRFVTTDPTWPTYFLTSTVWETTVLAAEQGQQNAAADATAASLVPKSAGLRQGPFLMSMTNCCSQESAAPYLPANIAFPGSTTVVSPVLGYGNAPNSGPNTNSGQTLQFGFSLTGNRGSQQSWFFVAAGNVNAGGSQPQLNGLFFGTSKPDSTKAANYALGGFGSTGFTLDSSGAPSSLTVAQSPQALAVTNNLSTATNYTFTQTATPIASAGPVFGPIGTNRPAVTLAGYAGGLVQTLDGGTGQISSPYVVTGASNTPSDVSITLNPTTSQVQATLKVASQNPAGTNPLNSAVYVFEPNTSTSAYIDYNYFGSVSVAGGSNTPASTVNGKPLQSTAQSLVNVSTVFQNIGGAAVCQCDYTRWGFWSVDNFRGGTGGTVSQDIGHANLFVAGQLPNISDVPASGTATYVGHVVAQVWNGTSQYLSGGAFTDVVDFGHKTGTVSAVLDHGVYSGTVNFNVNDPRNFSGRLPITNFDGSGLPYTSMMTLNGSFFKGVASPVGEMGGNVTVTAPGFPYTASGIFAARMQ